MALIALSLFTMVRCEASNFNGLPPPRSSNSLPHLSFAKPSWVVKTESNVRKKRRKKPDPPCVVCDGSGRVDCHRCHGKGRTNNVDLEMLPKGEWPKWCRTCGGNGLDYCSRCLGTGEYRYIMGFYLMKKEEIQSQENSGVNGSCLIHFSLLVDLLILLASKQQFNPPWCLAPLSLRLLLSMYSAAMSPNLETWHKLDRMWVATSTNEVCRKASISQGSALMRVASAMFSETPSLKTMRDTSLRLGSVYFHRAPIFGLICGVLGFEITVSQSAYLFITMRDVISAATRLNLVGPLGEAMLQHQIAPIAENILKKCSNRKAEEACQTAPLLEVVQGCHVYLFSSLFSS